LFCALNPLRFKTANIHGVTTLLSLFNLATGRIVKLKRHLVRADWCENGAEWPEARNIH